MTEQNQKGAAPTGQQKLLGMLGLAARARRLLCGTEIVCNAVRAADGEENGRRKKNTEQVRLVLIASDASQNTRKRIVNCCTYYRVAWREINADSESLAQAVGKNKGHREERARVSAVGIADESFAGAIHTILSKMTGGGNAGDNDPFEGE